MDVIRRALVALALLLALLAGRAPAALAEAAPAANPTPEQVRQLLGLLADPAVRDWIARGATAPPAAADPATPPPRSVTIGQFLRVRLGATRSHLIGLATAVPDVPDELAHAWLILSLEFEEQGLLSVLLLIAAFAALGFGAQSLFWRVTRGWRRKVIAAPLDTVRERLSIVFQRLLYGVLNVAAFGVGSVGAFLVFSWPPLLQEIVLAGLLVVLVIMTAHTLGRFALAPGGPRFRVLPMPQASADHWFFWVRMIAGFAALEIAILDLLHTLGVSEPVRDLLVLAYGCGGLTLGLVALFRRPAHRERLPGARVRTWLYAAWLGLAMVARTAGAFPLFVILLAAGGLPAALLATRRAVIHLLRPVGSEHAGDEPPSLAAAALERGLQAGLILVTVWLVASSFGLNIDMLTHDDSPFARLSRGVLNALVIVLVADLAWHLASSWIDRRLFMAGAYSDLGAAAQHALTLPPEEARRRSRELTLLPILRNIGFVALTVTAGMMALSALGVQVGPLLAGAGVVGIAVGFGAQTLVKDIISGMFYLLDDAFRVGEYIQSGTYKGTVESFSIRSIKQRHHRGPLYTVPFGVLGAVQNLSRDWVIDKLNIGITYDTDLDLVKRIVKQISKEIAADPELAPYIIDPLKSQGVYEFGPYAIQIRLKITTRPGEQFVIRRSVYSKIKKAFDANGIKFAFPTVQVSGGEGISSTAAAQAALELTRPPAAAE